MSSSTTGSPRGPRTTPTPPPPSGSRSCPASRVLNAPAQSQQVVVLVHLADGTTRDVTPICYYDSSNPEIADVDADGHVVFKTRGEVAVIAHYLDLVANVRLTHLVEVPGFQAAEVPPGQRDRPRRLRQAEPDADQPVRALHRP